MTKYQFIIAQILVLFIGLYMTVFHVIPVILYSFGFDVPGLARIGELTKISSTSLDYLDYYLQIIADLAVLFFPILCFSFSYHLYQWQQELNKLSSSGESDVQS